MRRPYRTTQTRRRIKIHWQVCKEFALILYNMGGGLGWGMAVEYNFHMWRFSLIERAKTFITTQFITTTSIVRLAYRESSINRVGAINKLTNQLLKTQLRWASM